MGRSDRKRSRSRSPNDRRSRRSRSPDSSRPKNRDKDRERDKDKDKDRDRRRSPNSSSSSNHRSSSSSHPTSSKRPRESSSSNESSRAPNREKLEDIVGRQSYMNFDIEKQNELLDKVMQERRERVEKWRNQQKVLGSTSNGKTDVSSNTKESSSVEQQSLQTPAPEDSSLLPSQDKQRSEDSESEKAKEKKKWSLDDELEGDDDDEDEEMNGGTGPSLIDDKDEHGNERELMAPKREEPKDDDDNIPKPKPKAARRRFTDAPEGQLPASNNDTKPLDSNKDNEEKPKEEEEVKIKDEEASKDKKEQVKEEEEEEEEEDDIDPLDAYMLGIQEEVKKSRKQIVKQGNSKVSVVVGIVNKKKTENRRGELLEENDDNFGASDGPMVSNEEDLAIALDTLNQAKAKKPQTISLDDITYMPFRKDFYIEVPEITAMTKQEVEALRIEMEGIKTKGKGCPRPIRTWAQCGVNRKVLETLKKSGFEKPTPIQCQAIPVIMSGRDMIGIAKTGSGKTLAFYLPMFRHILDQPPLEPGEGPIAVIMTPTRELAVQIFIQCRKFAKPMGLRTVAVYGGTPISEQIGDLKPGTEIVVCTPGRMIDMLAANSGRVTNLKRCTYIVLDEADRMFDMGFEPQVMKIIDGIRPDRQTVLFSATFPRIMEALARRILDKPIEVLVGGRSIVCKDIQQNIVVIDNDNKFLKLLEILGKFSNDGSAICFVDKQEHADWLLKELMLASYTALALHGGVDQSDRDSTISDFKAGKVNVLVATSVAARGLDVKHCIVVVNYDCPNHYEDYVHRCGRTGRAGNKGYAYTFITPEQGRYSLDLIKALQMSETDVPDELQKLFDQYKIEQEALGKTVKSSSGFSGKGFKFDEAEAAAAVEKKKAQKAALGMLDSDDEDEDGEKKGEGGDALDAEIESLLGAKKKAVPVSNSKEQQQQTCVASTSSTASSTSSVAATNGQAPLLSTPLHLLTPITATGMDKSLDAKMEQVRRAASKISMLIPNLSTNSNNNSNGNEPKPAPASHTSAMFKGDSLLGNIASSVNAKSLAEQRAEALNAKLNYAPRDEDMPQAPAPAPATANPFQRYEAELEINDFPQQARWRVTGKETIAQISDISEAGITVRGSFVAPGKEPGLGERKLYLAIEAMSERAIDIAKAEIIRIIKEEMARASTSTQQSKGRYKVL